ncbi:hypothetical protein KY284_013894 [Solanum tuberosum]|nr:hypothetical protein KY284_013894 [Solanum tuberosum]
MVPPHPQASNADERDHYALGKRILLQNESSRSCFPETSKALELHFSNYLEVVSDIDIEDTIVDNREDNDYNLSDEDDDFQDVIDDQQILIDDQQVLVDNQQVLIDDQQVKKLRGRPKNASVNMPVSSGILVPLQNADVEFDYAYSDELSDDDVQSGKGENNGQKNNIYEEYNEGKNKNLPRFALGMKFKNFKKFKEACRELGIRKRRQLRFKPNDQQRVVCICKVDGCPFRIYASKGYKRDPTVQIKLFYLKHKGAKVLDNFHLSPKYITRKYLNIFKADPGWNISGIVETNFKQKHKGKALKDLVWNAARARNKVIFQKCIEELDQEDKAAKEWFNNPERPFQRGPRVSIDDPGGVNIVDMKAKSCTCRRWELPGLPCPHSYVCIIGNSERVEDYVDTFYTIETFKNVYLHYINLTNPEDHWPEVVDCGEEESPNQGKKKLEELEKKKNAKAAGKAEKRAEQKSEKRQPQKLSEKGSTQVMCTICKKYGHNARGHYKFVKAGESSSSHYLEAISPAEEASNDGDYLNMYRPEMWNNNHQGLNLAYQSTITQAPIEEQVIVVQTDVVAAQGVDEVAIKGIESTRLSHTSKRGRLFKRKVMKEYIVEVQKKKKIGNHSRVLKLSL